MPNAFFACEKCLFPALIWALSQLAFAKNIKIIVVLNKPLSKFEIFENTKTNQDKYKKVENLSIINF